MLQYGILLHDAVIFIFSKLITLKSICEHHGIKENFFLAVYCEYHYHCILVCFDETCTVYSELFTNSRHKSKCLFGFTLATTIIELKGVSTSK